MATPGETQLPPGWTLGDAYEYDKTMRGYNIILAPGHFLDRYYVKDGVLRPFKYENNNSVFMPGVPQNAVVDGQRNVITYPDKNNVHIWVPPMMGQNVLTVPTTTNIPHITKPRCAWNNKGIPCPETGTGPVPPTEVENNTLPGLYCSTHRKKMITKYYKDKQAAEKANQPPPEPVQPTGKFAALPSIKPKWDSQLTQPEPEPDEPPMEESGDPESAPEETSTASLLRKQLDAAKSVEKTLKHTKQVNGLKAEKIKAVKLQAQAQELGITLDEPSDPFDDSALVDIPLPDDDTDPDAPPPIDAAELEANTDVMMELVNGLMWGVELAAPYVAKEKFGRTIRTDGLYNNYVNDAVAQKSAREALQQDFPNVIQSLGPTARALVHMGRVTMRTVVTNAAADSQKAAVAAVPKPVVEALANEYKDM